MAQTPRPRAKKQAPHHGHGARAVGRGPHDPDGADKIVTRLRTVEGHLRGIIQMVEEDAYCIDVLRQTKAVQAAIGRVESALLERHLEHCVSRAIRSEDESSRSKVIQEIVDVFDATRRS